MKYAIPILIAVLYHIKKRKKSRPTTERQICNRFYKLIENSNHPQKEHLLHKTLLKLNSEERRMMRKSNNLSSWNGNKCKWRSITYDNFNGQVCYSCKNFTKPGTIFSRWQESKILFK